MPRLITDQDMLAILDDLRCGHWISGAVIARHLGISREALSNRIERLRRVWCLEIQSSPRRGYYLRSPVERLTANDVRSALSPTWRDKLKVSVTPRTQSTNDELMRPGLSDDPQVLIAEYQSKGRGRRGRKWVSPFGANLYLSLSWTFRAWRADVTALPLAIGVCCVDALQDLGMTGIGLKWPNDLVIQGRKLGGVLIDLRGETEGACRAVIGVGINVTMTQAQAHGLPPTWLTLEEVLSAEVLEVPPRYVLAATVAEHLANGCSAFERTGFASFSEQWKHLDAVRDQEVEVLDHAGRWIGVARGVADDGGLLVEAAGHLRCVHGADVTLRMTQSCSRLRST